MGTNINRWPARLDAAQSLSGFGLVLFIWAHMFFESSILLGKDAMLWVTRMFEGAHLLERPYPALVSLAAGLVLALLAAHALLALRKFPANYRQYRDLNQHVRALGHLDTEPVLLSAVDVEGVERQREVGSGIDRRRRPGWFAGYCYGAFSDAGVSKSLANGHVRCQFRVACG